MNGAQRLQAIIDELETQTFQTKMTDHAYQDMSWLIQRVQELEAPRKLVVCPNCESTQQTWFLSEQRGPVLVLGCDTCSETLGTVGDNDLALAQSTRDAKNGLLELLDEMRS